MLTLLPNCLTSIMKIQYCSDLHLEFPENLYFLKQNPIKPLGDILILAGDILPFIHMEKENNFLNNIARNYEAVYWLPGNHEYYYSDINKFNNPLKKEIRENLFLVNNVVIKHRGINLIFSTLWGIIHPQNAWITQQNVSDFHVIHVNKMRFTVEHFNNLHKECANFIETSLKQNDSNINIVITHHVPTLMNYPEQYRKSNINEAFAIEMHDFILNNPIGYWIYGHHHVNIQEFKIGKTQLLTNQLGYVRYNEHKAFKNNTFIDIIACRK